MSKVVFESVGSNGVVKVYKKFIEIENDIDNCIDIVLLEHVCSIRCPLSQKEEDPVELNLLNGETFDVYVHRNQVELLQKILGLLIGKKMTDSDSEEAFEFIVNSELLDEKEDTAAEKRIVFCSQCGSKIDEFMVFCVGCGKPVEEIG